MLEFFKRQSRAVCGFFIYTKSQIATFKYGNYESTLKLNNIIYIFVLYLYAKFSKWSKHILKKDL